MRRAQPRNDHSRMDHQGPDRLCRTKTWRGWVSALCVPLAALLILVGAAAQKKRSKSEPVRGYTIMAGGLGRAPRDEKDMWSNTVAAHLTFIDQARINLVVVEVPNGVSGSHPKSAKVSSFIKQLRKKSVQVWVIYPHTLAQAFDLPRQVDRVGKRVEWKCCFNRQETRDWLVENGKSIADAYKPDGILLFGLFHKGGACHCAPCMKDKEAKSGRTMEKFFLRFSRTLREEHPKIKLGTTGFWTRPSRKALATVDVVSPVVGIFRPGYAKAGRVRKELSGLRSKYRGKLLVPYVKLFLASQTNSETQDVLDAAAEGLRYGSGFFFWGYNPGHSYAKQDYDHERIRKALHDLDMMQRELTGRDRSPSSRGVLGSMLLTATRTLEERHRDISLCREPRKS